MKTKRAKGAERKQDKGKTMSIYISGHPVRLSFAKEPDTVAAQRVRNCLIDSYIRQNAAKLDDGQLPAL